MYADHFVPLVLILHSEIRGEKPIHSAVAFALGEQEPCQVSYRKC